MLLEDACAGWLILLLLGELFVVNAKLVHNIV